MPSLAYSAVSTHHLYRSSLRGVKLSWLERPSTCHRPCSLGWRHLLGIVAGGDGLPRTGLKGPTVERWRPVGPQLPGVVDAEMVEEWTSRLNKLVRVDVSALWGRKLIGTVGKRPKTRYQLMIEPENIHWLDA